MKIYLPCRLGEEFIRLKFVGWVDGKRTYKEEKPVILDGFNAFDCTTRCLSIPTIHSSGGFLSYDPEGEFSQEFTPKFVISLDVKTVQKLSDIGFPGSRKARLCGLKSEKGCLFADFVTTDRSEHLIYQIKDTINYANIGEPVSETMVEYAHPRKSDGQITLFDLLG